MTGLGQVLTRFCEVVPLLRNHRREPVKRDLFLCLDQFKSLPAVAAKLQQNLWADTAQLRLD